MFTNISTWCTPAEHQSNSIKSTNTTDILSNFLPISKTNSSRYSICYEMSVGLYENQLFRITIQNPRLQTQYLECNPRLRGSKFTLWSFVSYSALRRSMKDTWLLATHSVEQVAAWIDKILTVSGEPFSYYNGNCTQTRAYAYVRIHVMAHWLACMFQPQERRKIR